MVNCIQNNHQNNKEGNLLDIVNEDLQQEMMLLSTNDEKDSKPSKIESDQTLKNEAYSVLSYDQVKRLHLVMEQVVPIHGKGNFPTLDIKLKDLVKVVKTKLETEQSIKVNDIRLNGGAASYVLLPENSNYNDLDLIFAVDLNDPQTYDKVRTAVLDSLLDFFPEGANRRRISLNSLKEAYIHKMVKVSEKDQWSLISLSNNRGRNVELKFVDTMKRQFEFSVDSFHIILDSLMLFYECSEMPIMENIYPTVLAESVYGNFDEAFMHLEKKLIATRQPEQIRGGGLLKYCNLLIRNYSPAQPKEIKNLERYMCSRFFIDFNELPQQKAKLESYLANHFNDDDWTKTQYLMQLYKVVDESTVCLMGHERRQTLALIEEMAYCFYIKSQQQHQPHSSHYQLYLQPTVYNKNQNFFPHFHHHHHHHNHHQMIRHHYDVLVAPSQKNSANNLSVSNQNLNNSLNSNSGNATTNNSSNQTNNNTIQQSAHHHSNHNSNCKNSTKNINNNASNNSTSQSQHIQQYHAYLFGTGANTFYYNPYHHHHNYQAQQHSCFNSCQCGAWMACA